MGGVEGKKVWDLVFEGSAEEPAPSDAAGLVEICRPGEVSGLRIWGDALLDKERELVVAETVGADGDGVRDLSREEEKRGGVGVPALSHESKGVFGGSLGVLGLGKVPQHKLGHGSVVRRVAAIGRLVQFEEDRDRADGQVIERGIGRIVRGAERRLGQRMRNLVEQRAGRDPEPNPCCRQVVPGQGFEPGTGRALQNEVDQGVLAGRGRGPKHIAQGENAAGQGRARRRGSKHCPLPSQQVQLARDVQSQAEIENRCVRLGHGRDMELGSVVQPSSPRALQQRLERAQECCVRRGGQGRGGIGSSKNGVIVGSEKISVLVGRGCGRGRSRRRGRSSKHAGEAERIGRRGGLVVIMAAMVTTTTTTVIVRVGIGEDGRGGRGQEGVPEREEGLGRVDGRARGPGGVGRVEKLEDSVGFVKLGSGEKDMEVGGVVERWGGREYGRERYGLDRDVPRGGGEEEEGTFRVKGEMKDVGRVDGRGLI